MYVRTQPPIQKQPHITIGKHNIISTHILKFTNDHELWLLILKISTFHPLVCWRHVLTPILFKIRSAFGPYLVYTVNSRVVHHCLGNQNFSSLFATLVSMLIKMNLTIWYLKCLQYYFHISPQRHWHLTFEVNRHVPLVMVKSLLFSQGFRVFIHV